MTDEEKRNRAANAQRLKELFESVEGKTETLLNYIGAAIVKAVEVERKFESQHALATAVGLSDSMMSNIVNARQNMEIKTLCKILERIGELDPLLRYWETRLGDSKQTTSHTLDDIAGEESSWQTQLKILKLNLVQSAGRPSLIAQASS